MILIWLCQEIGFVKPKLLLIIRVDAGVRGNNDQRGHFAPEPINHNLAQPLSDASIIHMIESNGISLNFQIQPLIIWFAIYGAVQGRSVIRIYVTVPFNQVPLSYLPDSTIEGEHRDSIGGSVPLRFQLYVTEIWCIEVIFV